jgi:hypothetical protein
VIVGELKNLKGFFPLKPLFVPSHREFTENRSDASAASGGRAERRPASGRASILHAIGILRTQRAHGAAMTNDSDHSTKPVHKLNAATRTGQDARPALPSTSGESLDSDASMDRVVRVEVPIRVESPNRLHAEHPLGRARRVRRERAAVREALDRFERPAGPWLVTLIRVAPRRLDDDNAVAAMKAPRDATAEWLGVDDRDPKVRFVVAQERGAYAVRVNVGYFLQEQR